MTRQLRLNTTLTHLIHHADEMTVLSVDDQDSIQPPKKRDQLSLSK